jgi:hypothetical protein
MLGLMLLFAGCAGNQLPAARGSALRQGDATAPPSLAVLPALEPADSQRWHRGMTLAGQAFARGLPPPPADRSFAALSEWVEQDVATWIAARRESMDETRFQFGSNSGAGADAEILRSAVVGLLQEDTAQALASMPAPSELDSEPEIAELYRELVRVQSEPFVGAARGEYRTCADRAEEEGGTLTHFAAFCRARFERITPTATLQPTAAKR